MKKKRSPKAQPFIFMNWRRLGQGRKRKKGKKAEELGASADAFSDILRNPNVPPQLKEAFRLSQAPELASASIEIEPPLRLAFRVVGQRFCAALVLRGSCNYASSPHLSFRTIQPYEIVQRLSSYYSWKARVRATFCLKK